MSAYFEIAYAVAAGRLCLFTGTGFSKAVTENNAPSWEQLLSAACDMLPNAVVLKAALFPPVGAPRPLSLEEAAQVIDLELKRHVGKRIYEVIAPSVAALTLSGDNAVIEAFFKAHPVRVITTNYDKLIEALKGDGCQSVSPGFPIPRADADTKVYHVHGSVDSPTNMVVTSDDYFKFMHGESYFSRKLSTLLHENTVVILGYSLGDTNLKSIMSDYRGFARANSSGGNMFLVSRSKVDLHVKMYYAHCYGIRVLDDLKIHDFFEQLTKQVPAAKKYHAESIPNINKVLGKTGFYTDDYLKIDVSYFEIINAVGGIGRNINDPEIVAVLERVISKKIELTGANGAWEQYEQLAEWLCHLATTLELAGSAIEETFLRA
ncbi:MAG: SIR2 family NAD-dependent protein deacylase, partial [Polaromonas sp.]|uniref:SIR2 family NAD-dependent protein deacylase n=1 Tax=Polaromonas sp. TaxID=1869339 RepID=UPI0040359BFD